MSQAESEIAALRLTRKESRLVLDHQIALLNELDDKALRTARTAVVVLGILVSAVGIAGRGTVLDLPLVVQVLGGAGGVFLSATVLVGIALYSSTDITFGIGDGHRDELANTAYTEREWLKLLLTEYADWSDTMERLNETNAERLLIAQLCLSTALLSLLSAVGLLWIIQ